MLFICGKESFRQTQAVKKGFHWGMFLMAFIWPGSAVGAVGYAICIRSLKFALFAIGVHAVVVVALYLIYYVTGNAVYAITGVERLGAGLTSIAYFVVGMVNSAELGGGYIKDQDIATLIGSIGAIIIAYALGATANKFRAQKLLDSGYKKILKVKAKNKVEAVAMVVGASEAH